MSHKSKMHLPSLCFTVQSLHAPNRKQNKYNKSVNHCRWHLPYTSLSNSLISKSQFIQYGQPSKLWSLTV